MFRFTVVRLLLLVGLAGLLTALVLSLTNPARPHRKVGALAFSPDGRMLAVRAYAYDTDHDGVRTYCRRVRRTLALWDVATRLERVRLEDDAHGGDTLHVRSIGSALAFSPDGTRLATVDDLGGGRIWSLNDIALELDISRVDGVAWLPDSKTIALSYHGWIDLWDVATGASRARVSLKGRASWLAFSTQGSVLIAAGGIQPSVVERFDVTTLAWLPAPVQDVEWELTSMATSPLTNELALTLARFDRGHQTAIVRWNADTGKEERLLNTSDEWIRALAYSPDGGSLISASSSGTIRIFDMLGSGSIREYSTAGNITALAIAPDGKILATGDMEGSITLWDMNSMREIARFTGIESGRRYLHWSLLLLALATWVWLWRRTSENDKESRRAVMPRRAGAASG